MDILKHYVGLFNKNDNELYKNLISNDEALGWLSKEIPIFECPDKHVEEIYYFRWWTYRKHLKQTPEGYVITEFLPKVRWSGKYNVINAANGHHLMEGRWLKNSATYFKDYINFYLNNNAEAHKYSSWLIFAIYEFIKIKGVKIKDKDFIKKLCKYYEEWEQTHLLPNGMFWSFDNYDAMEFSISGTTEDGIMQKGIRPTLNSYMCADCLALSNMAKDAGMTDISDKYLKKHKELKDKTIKNLWDGGFFKAYHYPEDDYEKAFQKRDKNIAMEEIGFIPWYFDIPPQEFDNAFELLENPKVFYTPFGITTSSQSEERFLYNANHECLWNGYIWPYATSQTLTALINVIKRNKDNEKYKDLFVRLLSDYAKSQYITLESGKKIPWIDEVKHPKCDEWTSRALLCDWNWREDKGGKERGKDYNHSTFCDLVISGLFGVDLSSETTIFNPVIPDKWEYMSIRGLNICGDEYDIYYDKNGTKYKYDKGLTILKNGAVLEIRE